MEEQTSQAISLRFPLFGLRVIGVVTALALTSFNQDPSNFPPVVQQNWMAFSGVLTFIELVLGAIAMRANGLFMIFLILVDLLFGFAMGYFSGTPYLVLGFMLPVIETTAFCGGVAGLVLFVIGTLFFGVAITHPLLNLIRATEGQKPELIVQAIMSLRLAGVLAVLTGFCLWLTQTVLGETFLVLQLENQAEQERQMLQQTINQKEQEREQSTGHISSFLSEITKLEQEGDKDKAAIRDLNAKVNELEELLLQLDGDLKRAKSTEQKLKEAVKQAEDRSNVDLSRQKNDLEREHFVIQKKYDKLLRLLTICRDLNLNLGLNETLLALNAQVQKVVPSETFVVFLVDEVNGHRELFPELAASPHLDAFKDRVLQFDEEAPGWCAAHRRPLRIDEGKVQAGDRVLATLTPHEMSAMICPLVTSAGVVGVIYLGRPESAEFSPEEGEFLLRIAEFAAQCVANSLEYQRRINHGLSDYATRLYNGLFLEERMKEEVMRGRRYTYPVTLILFQLDGFSEALPKMDKGLVHKVVNEVADIVRAAVRETDVPARMEDNLFGVLLVHTERDKTRAIGERIRAGLEQRIFNSAQAKFKFTISGGIAGVPHDGTSSEMLRKRAQDGLALAKSKGGNQVCFWDQT